MQPKNLVRFLKALAKQGLNVTYADRVYTIHLDHTEQTVNILIPEGFPVEAKAIKQLANLASISHPSGGCICQACATPDFHPGDAGVAIGSVIATQDLIIPGAVGSDINCGMRLHVADLSIDRFLAQRDRFVELLKGDYFFGTRDVTMTPKATQAMLKHGTMGWLDATLDQALGSVAQSDLTQIAQEIDRIYLNGSLTGDLSYAPSELMRENCLIRDDGMATIGGGNHFVEMQVVRKVEDPATAYRWGVKAGQMAFMIHSGSRSVGKYIGGMWRERAKNAWPKHCKYPESGLFPISAQATPELFNGYLLAEATAANYGFLNRLLLAELLRLRLRQVFGDIEASLVYDLPHNITLAEGDRWVTRKGACPAHWGQPTIVPGSMGTPSYLLMGQGNDRFLSSASHGAGRVKSRFTMSHETTDLGLTGIDCITLREDRKIEEAPGAYKPIQPIVNVQVEAKMVSIVAILDPVLTFKA